MVLVIGFVLLDPSFASAQNDPLTTLLETSLPSPTYASLRAVFWQSETAWR